MVLLVEALMVVLAGLEDRISGCVLQLLIS